MVGKTKRKNGNGSYKKAEVVPKKTSPVKLPGAGAKLQQSINKTELVSNRAYELWLLDGKRHGRDMHHWFEAEREINQN